MDKIKDWHHEILKHLYNNFSHTDTRLNEFVLTEFDLDKSSQHDAYMVEKALKELFDKKFIEYTLTKNIDGKSREESDKISAFGRKLGEAFIPGTIDNYLIDARLLMDGYSYVNNKLRDERQDKIIDTQTRLSWVAVGVTAASLIASFVSVYFTATDTTSEEFQSLNTQYQKMLPLLEKMQQSQKGLDSSVKVYLERSTNNAKSKE
jgi:hypothetical protein